MTEERRAMDFSFTEEQEKLRKEVHDYVSERIPADYSRDTPVQGKKLRDWTLELQKDIGEKGWLAAKWPKEYGGMGLDDISVGVISEELGMSVPNYVAYRMAVPALFLFGTEEQQRKYVPPLAKGANIEWMQVFTEPDAGTDESNIQLKAVEDGDSYVLNGSKIFVGDAWYPHYLYTEARTADVVPRHRGLSLFMIPADTPGITYRAMTTMGGQVKNEIFFSDVRIPKDCLIGQKNRGFYHAMTTFEFERTGTAISTSLRRPLEEFVQYCKETKRNGKAIFDDPVVRDKLAEMIVEVEVIRLFCWVTQWKFANREKLGGLDYDLSGYLAKILPPKHIKVYSDILGLYGQLLETSDERRLRGSVARRWESTRSLHAAGSFEARKIVLAGRGLGLPRIPGRLNKTIGDAIKERMGEVITQTAREGG